MNFELSLLNSNLLLKQAVSEVLSCNDITEKYNLLLTNTQAAALVETRVTALKDNGRIEFGAGVIQKIILAFCDSPYISMHNYEETIHELLEIFYYYKNETNDLMSDDELIKFMKISYDSICQGSLELLSGRELNNLARTLRYAYKEKFTEDKTDLDEEDSLE